MNQPEAATQVRFAQFPAGVPDDDTWRFTHDPTPEPAEGEVTLRVEYLSVDPAMRDLSTWMKEGKIVTREHILEGIECFPDAVKMIFAGQNDGKLLIKL
jgi:NADPH-dependent curcumin reductase CurA